MSLRIAVLVDESDRRLGKIAVAPSCFVVQHGGAYFVRTDKGVRLRPADRAIAVVFEQTEVYVRERLETI